MSAEERDAERDSREPPVTTPESTRQQAARRAPLPQHQQVLQLPIVLREDPTKTPEQNVLALKQVRAELERIAREEGISVHWPGAISPDQPECPERIAKIRDLASPLMAPPAKSNGQADQTRFVAGARTSKKTEEVIARPNGEIVVRRVEEVDMKGGAVEAENVRSVLREMVSDCWISLATKVSTWVINLFRKKGAQRKKAKKKSPPAKTAKKENSPRNKNARANEREPVKEPEQNEDLSESTE